MPKECSYSKGHLYKDGFCAFCLEPFVQVDTQPKFVDLTPSWSGILSILLYLYEQGDDQRETALEELQKMARAADNWNELAKLTKEKNNA